MGMLSALNEAGADSVRLTFDEEKHEYRVGARRIPGVTEVLRPLIDLSHIPADRLERARQEGKAIHKMVELDCLDNLDEAVLPEWMLPVLRAWREFREVSGFSPLLNEQRVYSRAYGYAGTLDMVCELPKLASARGAMVKGPMLIDVKRSLYGGPVTGLQTAAYLTALGDDFSDFRRCQRAALRLSVVGKFELHQFSDPTDSATFLSMLSVHRFVTRNNLKDPKWTL